MLTEERLNQIPGLASDWTIPQRWERFTGEEHRVWDLLFARQQRQLAGRAIAAFGRGLDVLRLSRPGIPDFDELNDRLFARTGWTVGAGWEYGFTPNWSARLEYRYTDFGTFRDNSTFSFPGFTYEDHPVYHTIRGGISYRFGGPVVARY